MLHPLAHVASALWMRLRGGREGAIALPQDGEREAQRDRPRGAREVDVDALWG